KRAFGESIDGFDLLLSRPDRYIFNRVWYEERGGAAEFTEYQLRFSRLSTDERAELIALLSSTVPSKFMGLRAQTTSEKVRDILEFYPPLTDIDEAEIWKRCREHRASTPDQTCAVPEDERVEDAGLLEP